MSAVIILEALRQQRERSLRRDEDARRYAALAEKADLTIGEFCRLAVAVIYTRRNNSLSPNWDFTTAQETLTKAAINVARQPGVMDFQNEIEMAEEWAAYLDHPGRMSRFINRISRGAAADTRNESEHVRQILGILNEHNPGGAGMQPSLAPAG